MVGDYMICGLQYLGTRLLPGLQLTLKSSRSRDLELLKTGVFAAEVV